MTFFVDRETVVTASWLNAVDGIITDPTIVAIADMGPVADQLIYFTAPTAAALASFTATGRAIVGSADAPSVLATIGAVAKAGDTMSGDLEFTGSSRRIKGTFSGTPHSTRTLFKNSIVDASTLVGLVANGAGTTSTLNLYAGSDPDNVAFGQLTANGATGEVRLSAGLQGAGSYYPITIYTSGIERLRIDTSGHVGIGTSSAANLVGLTKELTISSGLSTDTTSGINIQGSRSANNSSVGSLSYFHDGYRLASIGAQRGTTGAEGRLRFYTLDGAGSHLERMAIHENGRVNIGPNATPAANLQLTTVGGSCEFRITDGTDILQSYVTGGTGVIGTVANAPLTLRTNATSRITIDSSGFTNVGSSAVDARVKVTQRRDLSNPYALILTSYTTGPTFENDFFAGMASTGFVLGNYQAYDLEFRTNNTERFRLTSGGKIKFTAPDLTGDQFLFSGTTKGVRIYTGSSGSVLEGVDYTGTGSYQPLQIGGSSLSFATSGTEYLGLEADGRFFGKGLHNNGTVTGTTKQYLASGTYTPTYTNVANTSAGTPAKCQWTRVGNVVSVSGRAAFTVTAANTLTRVRLTLPIASNLAATADLNGTMCGGETGAVAACGKCIADTTNDQVEIVWRSSATTGSLNHSFTFQYEVL